MARTPLLRSIFQLARDHARAARERVPVEAIQEARIRSSERRPSPISRRGFLRATGAAAAAAAITRSRIARAAGAPRVAIVGGGISGLSAALTLADAGVASTVYESSGRVGGRMFSNTSYWDEAQVSEWCGELIDSSHKTVLSLAKRFGLSVADLVGAQPNKSQDTYYFGGHYYSADQANTDFQAVHQALNDDVQAASYPTLYNLSTPGGQELDAMSVYDWIESRVPGGHSSPMGQLLDVAYNIEYGAETTDQSALNLVYLLGFNAKPGNFSIFGKSDERYHIVGGNQQLPNAMASYLGIGSNVVLGMYMLALAMNADGTYALTFDGPSGTTVVTADIVILALPFAVLRNLAYGNAGLSALKHQAIQELGRGTNGKLQLQFTSRLWEGMGAWPGIGNGNSYADTGYQNTWEVTRAQSGTKGILVDYTGGLVTESMKTNVSWATASNPAVRSDAQRFLQQLEPVYPGITALWNGKAASSLPHLDPNKLCSYSYWRKGQYTTIAGYERVPEGLIFFAGEHTSIDFQGFMEGGAAEGVRAANEVLTTIGK